MFAGDRRLFVGIRNGVHRSGPAMRKTVPESAVRDWKITMDVSTGSPPGPWITAGSFALAVAGFL